MASTSLLRLLPLLLFLLPRPFREYYLSGSHQPKDVGVGELHPIVVVPGVSCSDLEARLTETYRPSVPRCGAMKGKGWFGIWENSSDLLAHDYVQCFEEQMSLVYDPAINDYRNLPGVETRVPNFGVARGFHEKNPFHPEWCLTRLIEALERIGYRDGDTLLGAPYDIRHAPPIPGQPSEVYSRYFARFRRLVEDASKRKQHKKVIIFGHSFGGNVALEFVRNAPMAWRQKYIKHLILAAPTLSAGFVDPVKNLASGPYNLLYVPTATALSLRPMWRSFETNIANFPSPAVFGDTPIVITKQRNYSSHDMEDFLAAIGFSDGIEPFRRRTLPKMHYFEAPMVPMTCINGVGNRTPQQLVYWESDFDELPEIVYGDGDGDINLVSMLAFDKEMGQQPRQKGQFKSIKLDKAQHGAIVSDEWALKRVIQEILEANRISS
ncbi:lecithin-cholesterol acyltransferase-like 1 [Phragmites australis]|uniref:lecithin-cholesterol acyltransferase-like 1 n=1 Tax=Phragmites australis TaxID=29695 RepID=UPI002D771F14|nr:lecithin-cholesterol acyltransferase-like 1 [Phragmites australis]